MSELDTEIANPESPYRNGVELVRVLRDYSLYLALT